MSWTGQIEPRRELGAEPPNGAVRFVPPCQGASLSGAEPLVNTTVRPRVAPRVLAMLTALLAAVGVNLMWHYFVNTAGGQRIDRAAFEGAAFEQGRLWAVAQPVLNVVSYTLVIAGAIIAVLIAVMRKRVLLAVQMLVLVGGANLTTQLIKEHYPRPSLLPGWTGPNSLPSGHTTVAASVSAALLLAAPRRWRPLIAVLGAGWTIAMGLSTMVGQWHRPADVIAAVLVVLAWSAAICAVTTRHTTDPLDDSAKAEIWTEYSVGRDGLMRSTSGVNRAAAIPVASWVVSILMACVAGIGGAIWLVVLIRLLDASPDVSSYYVTAYGGGAAGVVAFTLASFAALLIIRQATGAPRTPFVSSSRNWSSSARR